MTTPDANDVLFGSGIPAARFTSPGDTYAGPIVKLEAVQARKFKDGKPTDELDVWPNGEPKMQAVATLRTDHRDASDPSDDGQRKLYIASRDLQAKVRDAVRQAGKRKLDVGDFLQVTYTGDEKTESGLYAKVYEVTFQAASAAAANAALDQKPQYAQGGVVGQVQAQAPAANVPPVQQLIQPDQAAPAAAGATDLSSLPAEAQALVQKMLAQQQA